MSKLQITCPITLENIVDPILTPDGHTYEKKAIVEWVSRNGNSPLTKKRVSLFDLKPNYALLQVIAENRSAGPAEPLAEPPAELVENILAEAPAEALAEPLPIITFMHNSEKTDTIVTVTVPLNTIPKKCAIILCIDISGSMNTTVYVKKEGGNVECDGLTQLDIVKHASITIIENMDSTDILGIVTYDYYSNVKLKPVIMNLINKKIAIEIIKSLFANGSTNIYQGLVDSIVNLNTIPNHFYKSVLLLTDGVPNIEPSNGTLEAFSRFKTTENVTCDIYSFAFGEKSDSSLLNNISSLTNGSFAFIPDGTMVGTVFVNAISNIKTIAIPRMKVYDLDFGIIRIGQPKYIYRNTYLPSDLKIQYDEVLASYLKARGIIFSTVRNSYLTRSHDNTISNLVVDSQLESIRDLLADVKDQIFLALSEQYFSKWGKHYILSFLNAHEDFYCNNFKDKSVQHYGGDLFKSLRRKCEDIFLNIEPPKPSAEGYENYVLPQDSISMNYYSSGSPCMTRDTIVYLADGSKILLSDLKKGDVVVSGNKISVVTCVICTLNCEQPVVDFDELKITPWHPVWMNEWRFPKDIHARMLMYSGTLYNIVLESRETIRLGSFQVATLGHNLTGPVIYHPYFGTDLVIYDLMKMEGWEEGRIILNSGCAVRGSYGLVKKLVQN